MAKGMASQDKSREQEFTAVLKDGKGHGFTAALL